MGIQIDGINNRVTTGDIVSQTGSFSSDVGIGGTLTYEDVSNIDSVGVITARSGINVSSGDINVSSGKIGISSIIPASKFTVKGGPIFVGDNSMHGGSAGVIEFGGNSGHFDLKGYSMGGNTTIRMFTSSGGTNTEKLRITSNGHLLLGTSTDYADNNSDDLQIYGTGHTGMSITSGSSNYGSIYFGDATSGDSRNRGIVRYDHTYNNMELWTNAVERVRISSGGSIGVSHDLAGTSNYNRLMLNNPHDGSCWLQMTSTASGNGANTDGLSIGLNSSNVAHIWQRENAKMAFATNGTSRMEISANGIVTKPNTPAFRAHDSNHAQNGFLTFDQITTNVGSHYNGSNGRFTVPIAGTYFFTFYGMLATSSGNARVEYYINGSVHSSGEHYGGVAYTNGTTYNLISCSTILTLSQNDYVNLNWNTSYNSMHSYHNGFMGFLIG